MRSKREKLSEISIPKKIVATAIVQPNSKSPAEKKEIEELKNEINLLIEENKELETKNEGNNHINDFSQYIYCTL